MIGCPNSRASVRIVKKNNLKTAKSNPILTPSLIGTCGVPVGVAVMVLILVGCARELVIGTHNFM